MLALWSPFAINQPFLDGYFLLFDEVMMVCLLAIQPFFQLQLSVRILKVEPVFRMEYLATERSDQVTRHCPARFAADARYEEEK